MIAREIRLKGRKIVPMLLELVWDVEVVVKAAKTLPLVCFCLTILLELELEFGPLYL